MNASTKSGHGLLIHLAWLLPLLTAGGSSYLILRDHPDETVAHVARARDDIRAISSVLLAGEFPMPTSTEGLRALVDNGQLPHIPNDPWGNPYRYLNPGEQLSWELFSLGPDGIVSKDDIVSWNLYGGR